MIEAVSLFYAGSLQDMSAETRRALMARASDRASNVSERTASIVATLRAGQADALERRAADAEAARHAAERRLDALESGFAEREAAFAREVAQIKASKEELSQRFGEVGAQMLEAAERRFLERADARFRESETRGEEKVKAVLAPVAATLKRYEEGVAKVEEARRTEAGNLTGLIEQMRAGQDRVRDEAAKLVNALRAAPKARGRWGEQQLRNVLETCGLAEHTDFAMEVSVESGDGRLRPDAIIRLPGGQRSLVIDAKVSLNAYQDAHGAVEDAERLRHMGAHAASMKAHVTGLGAKAYWDQFRDSPDYVIMFVPGEHFLAAALEHDPTLWDYAFGRKVLLATPTNLIAIARTVAAVWRQEAVAKQATEIGLLGKEMYDRLATASGLLKRVGGGLSTAVESYNKFVSSFESRVLVTGRKFRELKIETGAKEIEETAPVEALPRYGSEGRGEGSGPRRSRGRISSGRAAPAPRMP